MHQKGPMDEQNPAPSAGQRAANNTNPAAPIKLPNPPDEKQAETPKVGSRDAPGG